MHHFFIDKNSIVGSEIVFSERDRLHMKRVLRLRPGEKVSASDGDFFYTVLLTSTDEDVRGNIVLKEPSQAESPLYSILIQGIAKGEKMDFIVQKATELGISEIIPVETTFCVVKLDDRKRQERTERWQNIAYEAAKQSKRAVVPRVHAPVGWKEVFNVLPPACTKIVLWENEVKQGLKAALKEIKLNTPVALFIGPEGGFSSEESAYAVEKGAVSVSLGKRILRTETAGSAAIAILQFALGDLGGENSAG